LGDAPAGQLRTEADGYDRWPSPVEVLQFRNFRVLPGDRLLLRDSEPVDLGGRAFDLLLVLLRARGSIVGKDEIVSHVWPSTLVDESNLRFQMACLRRALGEDRDVIKTVQGRGYLFVAEVSGSAAHRPGPLDISPARTVHLDRRRNAGNGHSGAPLVAVIDDDDDTREALDGLLRSSGLQVECYPSAQAFLDAGRSAMTECLVLDVWLPGRSGLDFQSDLAREGLCVPIIFISGHADIHMSVRAMKAGAVEFLTKPVRHEDLLGAIHAAVVAGRAAQISEFEGGV
jgi:DNA-binding response OmpR family regulator